MQPALVRSGIAGAQLGYDLKLVWAATLQGADTALDVLGNAYLAVFTALNHIDGSATAGFGFDEV